MRRSSKIGFALISISVPAGAATIDHAPFGDGIEFIGIQGPIVAGDDEKFSRLAVQYKYALVALDSDGGQLLPALEIGKEIHIRGYSTVVGNGKSCASACALIWIAGSTRWITPTGQVGFHASYLEANGRKVESGVANALVGRYLTQLDLPESSVIYATSAGPDSIQWLRAADHGRSSIPFEVLDTKTTPTSRDAAVSRSSSAEARNSPPPIQVVENPSPTNDDKKAPVWRQVGNWTIAVDSSMQNGCFMFGSWNNGTVFRVGVDRRSKDGYYLLFSNPDWTSLKKGQTYDLQFQFDSRSPWTGPTSVIDLGDNADFLYATFDDPSFWNEFSNSAELDISRDGKSVTQMMLPGAKVAFDELATCQRAQDSQARTRDPFAQ